MSMADIIMQGTARGLESRSRGMAQLGQGIAGAFDWADKKEERETRLSLVNKQNTIAQQSIDANNSKLASQKKIKDILGSGEKESVQFDNLISAGEIEAARKVTDARGVQEQQHLNTTIKQIDSANKLMSYTANRASGTLATEGMDYDQEFLKISAEVSDMTDGRKNMAEGFEKGQGKKLLNSMANASNQVRAANAKAIGTLYKNTGDKIADIELQISRATKLGDDKLVKSLRGRQDEMRKQNKTLNHMKNLDNDLKKYKLDETAYGANKAQSQILLGADPSVPMEGETVVASSDVGKLKKHNLPTAHDEYIMNAKYKVDRGFGFLNPDIVLNTDKQFRGISNRSVDDLATAMKSVNTWRSMPKYKDLSQEDLMRTILKQMDKK